MILDLTMLTFLFLFALVVVAIVLMSVYRRGFNDGERFGAAREEAKAWRGIATAQARAEAVGLGIIDKTGDQWPDELPDSRKEGTSC